MDTFVSTLQFVIVLHSVQSSVDAIPQERCVLIAIVLGSPLTYSHRGSFSFFVFDEFNDDGVVATIRQKLIAGPVLDRQARCRLVQLQKRKRTLSQSEIKRSVTDNKTCNPRHRTKALKEHRQHAQTRTVSTNTVTNRLCERTRTTSKKNAARSHKKAGKFNNAHTPAQQKRELHGAERHKQHHAARGDGLVVFLTCPALIYL